MHQASQCRPYSPLISSCFPNLHALRLSPNRESFRKSRKGLCCDASSNECHLVKHLNPVHVVYRNIGVDGLTTPFNYKPSRLTTVTYVFPADGRLSDCPAGLRTALRADLLHSHWTMHKVRIVFSHDEAAAPSMGKVEALPSFPVDPPTVHHELSPAFRDGLYDLLYCAVTRPGIMYEICGGEVLLSRSMGAKWMEGFVKRVVKERARNNPAWTEDRLTIMSRQEWKATREAEWEMGPKRAGRAG